MPPDKQRGRGANPDLETESTCPQIQEEHIAGVHKEARGPGSRAWIRKPDRHFRLSYPTTRAEVTEAAELGYITGSQERYLLERGDLW